LLRVTAKVQQKMPRKAPAMTSLGKWSPKMTMQIPVAIARRVNGIHQSGCLVHTTVATVNAVVVCPEGSP
jgi:hypothetical protein